MTLLQKAKTDILFSNSVFIFLTRFFPVLAVLLVQIVYSRQLPQDIYGSYQNFWVQLYIFAAIACAGVHVFVITYPADHLIRLVYGRLKYVLAFLCWLTVTCLAFAFMQEAHGYSLWLPFVFLFVHSLSAIAESFLIVFKKVKHIAWLNCLYSVIFCYLHFQALSATIQPEVIFTYVLLLMTGKMIVYFLIVASYVRSNRKASFSSELVNTGVGSLWFHMGLYDLLNIFARWADKFIVSLLLAESVSGLYFNGAVDIPFIPLIVGAAGSAILIQLAVKEGRTEPAYTVGLANSTSRVLSAIIFPLFFFFVLFRQELFDVVFTSKFSEAVPIFLASCLIIPLRAYSFTTVLQNRNKGAIINAGAILDLVIAFTLIYPLYQLLGLAGIALSFSIATYIQAIFYLYHTSKALQVPILSLFPYRNWLSKLIIFAFVFIGIHYLCGLYLSQAQTLTLGLLATGGVILISLWMELKRSHNDAAE